MSPWWLRPSAEDSADTDAKTASSPKKDSATGPATSVVDAKTRPAAEEPGTSKSDPRPPHSGANKSDAIKSDAIKSGAKETSRGARSHAQEDDDRNDRNARAKARREDDDERDHDDERDDAFDDEDEADDEDENGEDGEDDPKGVASESSRSGSRRRGRRGRGSRGGRGRSSAGNGDSGRSDSEPTDSGRPQSTRGNGSQEDQKTDEPARIDRDRRHTFDADDLLFELASAREMIEPVNSTSVNDEAKIALFCDLENVALGVRDSKEVKKFDINLVLERLLEKGKIVVKKAYCDWERYSEFKRPFHEAAIEMIDIPQKRYSGKNSADIKMVVDAMDLSYSKEHVDTFVILSGDSDFSPLVSKLKENDKRVIGVGVKGASSKLLIANCDEFIYYEDVWRSRRLAPKLEGMSQKTAEAFALMVDAIQALVRENKTVLWGSMIKQTMQRKNPSFNEGYYGYGSFSELLEDAEKKKIVKIKMDKRAGSYIVTGFAKQ